ISIVLEFQGVGGLESGEQLVPGAFIHEEIDVLLRGNSAVMAAIGADIERANESLADVHVAALIALFPGVCRDLELDSLGCTRLAFLFEPGHSRHIVTKRTI